MIRSPSCSLDKGHHAVLELGLIVVHTRYEIAVGHHGGKRYSKAQGRGQHGLPYTAGKDSSIDLATHLLNDHKGLDHTDNRSQQTEQRSNTSNGGKHLKIS